LSVAEEIECALLFRVKSGQYPASSRLPSVRELAREFGVNKNTIARVYQSLMSKGYLRSATGKGVFVVESPNGGGRERGAQEMLGGQLAAVVWRAKLLGMAVAEVGTLFDDALRRVYLPASVRLLFVECNEYDAQNLGRQLGEALGLPPRLALLSDLTASAVQVCRDVDIAVTTFYHLAIVRDAVAEAHVPTEVVGIHAPPEQSALLRIARVPQGSRVLIVCTEDTTLNTITNQVRAHNVSLKAATHLLGRGDLEGDLREADYVVDTQTSHEAVLRAGCEVPVITLAFTVDHQSLEFLRGRVGERMSQQVAESLQR